MITIKINYKNANWNEIINISRKNKYAANNHKIAEQLIIRNYLKNMPVITEYPIEIKCEWHVKNLNSDLDNKSLKAILDEMQKSGKIKNDNIKHIRSINHIAVKDSSDYLILKIKKYEE